MSYLSKVAFHKLTWFLSFLSGILIVSWILNNLFGDVGWSFLGDINTWLTVSIFLISAAIIGRKSASVRKKHLEVKVLNETMHKLKDFGTQMLSIPQEEVSLTLLAQETARIFNLEYCSIHVYAEGKWHHYTGTTRGELSGRVTECLIHDPDHKTSLMELVEEHDLGVRYARIQKDHDDIGLLVVKTDSVSPAALGTIGYMIGIRLVQVLEESGPFTIALKAY